MSTDDTDAIVFTDPISGEQRRIDVNSRSTDIWELNSTSSPYHKMLTEEQKAKARQIYEEHQRHHISINVDRREPYARQDLSLKQEDLELLRALSQKSEKWSINEEDQEKLSVEIEKREKELRELDNDRSLYLQKSLDLLDKFGDSKDPKEEKIKAQLKTHYLQKLEDIKAGKDPLQRETEVLSKAPEPSMVACTDKYGTVHVFRKPSEDFHNDYEKMLFMRNWSEQGDSLFTQQERFYIDKWLEEERPFHLAEMEKGDKAKGLDLIRYDQGNFQFTATKENGLKTLSDLQNVASDQPQAMTESHKEKLTHWIDELKSQQKEFAKDPNKITIDGIHYTENSSQVELSALSDHYRNLSEHESPPEQDLAKIAKWERSKNKAHSLAPDELAVPGRLDRQHELDNEYKITFKKTTPRGLDPEVITLSKDSDLADLKRVKIDYERGESYCTYNMRFDDYKQLSQIVKEKEPVTKAKPWKEPSENIEFELVCREFEEGDKVIVFAQGMRACPYFTEELTKDSSLDRLKEARERTSPEHYEGTNPAAALPPEKAELLNQWILEKEKERPELTQVKGLTPESDYMQLAALLAQDDPKCTPEEYRTVDEWARQKQDQFLLDMEKQDQLTGRKEVVRAIIFDQVQELRKDLPLEQLKFADDMLEMTPSHREKLQQWINDKELDKTNKATKLPSQEEHSNLAFLNRRKDRQAPVVTPWGIPNSREELAPGIHKYETPTHGGVWLSPERNRQIPDHVKDKTFLGNGHRGFYEEDLDIKIVKEKWPYIFQAQERTFKRRADKTALEKATDKSQLQTSPVALEEKALSAPLKVEKDREISAITVKKPDGKYEKVSPDSRLEDLIMLRKRVKTGERKVRKDELQALDDWIDEKKKKIASLDNKQLDDKKKDLGHKAESIVREISAAVDRSKKLISDLDSKSKNLQSLQLPPPPAPKGQPAPSVALVPGKITMQVIWHDGKSASFSASTRLEAVSKLLNAIDSRSDRVVSSSDRSALGSWAGTEGPKPSSMSFPSTPSRTPTPTPTPPRHDPPPPKYDPPPRKRKDKGR